MSIDTGLLSGAIASVLARGDAVLSAGGASEVAYMRLLETCVKVVVRGEFGVWHASEGVRCGSGGIFDDVSGSVFVRESSKSVRRAAACVGQSLARGGVEVGGSSGGCGLRDNVDKLRDKCPGLSFACDDGDGTPGLSASCSVCGLCVSDDRGCKCGVGVLSGNGAEAAGKEAVCGREEGVHEAIAVQCGGMISCRGPNYLRNKANREEKKKKKTSTKGIGC